MRKERQRRTEKGTRNLLRRFSGRSATRLQTLAEHGDAWAERRLEHPRFSVEQRRVLKRMRSKKRRALPAAELPAF